MSIVKNNGSVEVLSKTSFYDKRRVVVEWKRAIATYVKNGKEEEYNEAIRILLQKLSKKGYLEWTK